MKGDLILRLQRFALIAAGLVLITGCNLFGDDQPAISGPASCSDEDYNQYIYDTMKRYYYWYDEADPFNQINPRDTIAYPTPQSLVSALRYPALDRFSSVSDASSFNQFYGDGIFLGVGLRLLFDEITEDVLVAYAFINSDAYAQGIRRGDRIVEINSYPANGLSAVEWTAAWGTSEAGNVVQLKIEGLDTIIRDISVTKSLISIKSTQNSSIIDTNGKKVGYLHFTNFLGSTAIDDLDLEFDNFISNNVSELIVDLRYNGGGSVATARHLGSLIGGVKTDTDLFAKLIFNHKSNGYNGYSESSYFYQPSNALNLSRVIFITTDASCSASELVINSLIPDPDMEVIVVGSTSCGKPVGSIPQTHCDKALSVINFEIRNSANQGEYFNGIAEAYDGLTDFCNATDDLSLPLGDSNEASVSTAISYINNNQCSLATMKSAVKRSSFSKRLEEIHTGYENLY